MDTYPVLRAAKSGSGVRGSAQLLGFLFSLVLLACGQFLSAQSPRSPVDAQGQDPEIFQAYIRALLVLQDGAALSAAIKSELPGQNNPELLRFLARAALQVEQPQAAADAYHRLLQFKPEDAEALRWMGLLNFQKARYEAARHFLAQYLALGEGDYESLFCYGEILWKDRDTFGARPYYKLALRQIEATEVRSFAMKRIHAYILSRLGYLREAISAFDSLIQQWPEDSNLRADYAGVLIDHGKHKEAQRVLAMP
jgi:tetratricopeptide (TPR) repeat protein